MCIRDRACPSPGDLGSAPGARTGRASMACGRATSGAHGLGGHALPAGDLRGAWQGQHAMRAGDLGSASRAHGQGRHGMRPGDLGAWAGAGMPCGQATSAAPRARRTQATSAAPAAHGHDRHGTRAGDVGTVAPVHRAPWRPRAAMHRNTTPPLSMHKNTRRRAHNMRCRAESKVREHETPLPRQ